MNTQLLNDTEQLPPEAQQKIEAFIISIKELYQPVKKCQPTITKGDKSIRDYDFCGMWADSPRNLNDIRKKAWQRSKNKLKSY